MRELLRRASASSGRHRTAAFIGALALTSTLIGGCGSGGQIVTPSISGQSLFGAFAGYGWTGDVRQVSAVAVVPRIASSSPDGVAATWIGAEGVVNQSFSAPFVQVGINEWRIPAGSFGSQDSYFAFWSSKAAGFHPRRMFAVKPGDAVRLSLTLSSGRWTIDALDETSGKRARLSVAANSQAPYDRAIWTQEDPTNSTTDRQVSYPVLSGVRFSQMQVDGVAPSPRALQLTWMSEGLDTLGPTPARAGSFDVTQVHPSAEGLHYERMVVTEDLAATVFNSGFETWSTKTPARTIRTVSLRFARALEQQMTGLRSYHWTANVRALIARMTGITRATRQTVLRLAAHPSDYLTQAQDAFARKPIDQLHYASLLIKARLHIAVSDLGVAALADYVHAAGS
jgi:hypothetical protein